MCVCGVMLLFVDSVEQRLGAPVLACFQLQFLYLHLSIVYQSVNSFKKEDDAETEL